MQRLPCLLLVASALALAAPAAVAAPPTIDPSTLVPPPPSDARCTATGQEVICHTVIDFSVQAEPFTDFSMPCAPIYITTNDVRHGLRFYEDGLLVRRHVTAPGGVSGFLSLSPAGDGPRVQLVGHLTWWSTFTVPGDVDTESTTSHGLDTRIESPDGGVIAIIAGRTDPEGDHTGVARFLDDPAIAAAVCAALS